MHFHELLVLNESSSVHIISFDLLPIDNHLYWLMIRYRVIFFQLYFQIPSVHPFVKYHINVRVPLVAPTLPRPILKFHYVPSLHPGLFLESFKTLTFYIRVHVHIEDFWPFILLVHLLHHCPNFLPFTFFLAILSMHRCYTYVHRFSTSVLTVY